MKFLLSIALIVSCLYAESPADDSAKFATKSFQVEGRVLENLSFNLDNIKTLPAFTSGKRDEVCMSGYVKEKSIDYTGVLLKDILNQAKVKIDIKKEMNQIYVIVEASDGYKALFSYHEIFTSPLGQHIVLYYKKGDNLLGTQEGDFALMSLDDMQPGGRHVKWVSRIIVKIDR